MPRDTLVDFFHDLAALPGEFLVYDNGFRAQSLRYREIAGMARAFSMRCRSAGIGKGDSVVLWSENRPGWVAALWGCILDGIVAVPVDYRTSWDGVAKIAGIVNARALVAGDEVAATDQPPVPVWTMAEVERESAAGLEPVVKIEPDDIVEVVFTSGATGDPKGVTITHANLLANMLPVEREIARYKKYGRPFFPLRFLNLLPLSHLFGQAMATLIPPMLGGVVVFLARLAPEEIVEQVRRRRISVIVSVPRILEVLRTWATGRYPESGNAAKAEGGGGRWWWRWWRYRRLHRAFGLKFWAFVVGAAPLDPDLERFWGRLGFVVVQGYGLTETAPIVTLNHPFHARQGSVGRPISGVEIRIAADGEILVRGPNVTQGYFHNPEENRKLFEDGWLHTGDLGEIAPDGNLIVYGRKKDVIVTPDGLNVYPEDVERVLEEIPGVREAAVAGPDQVRAVLVLESGAVPDEAVRAANQRLEAHQRIRGVHVWPGAALPRTEGTAKLKRAAIRQWLDSGATPSPQPESGGASGVLEALRQLAPGRSVTEQTSLEELGLSSLDRVELQARLEQQQGIRVDEAALAGASSVADLLALPAQSKEQTPDAYPRWSRSWPARLLRRIMQPGLILPLTRYYARIEVRGLENLSGIQGPAILASNHQSNLDVPTILAALPSRVRCRIAPAMSREFFHAYFHPNGVPWRDRFERGLLYYLAAACFNAFPLPQREAGAGGALRYAGELASDGWWILIFPEGVRTETGEIAPFRPGVAMMASRLALPVVPVRLKGLEKVLHKSATRATAGPVEVSFGVPLTPTNGDWSKFASQIEAAVRAL